MPIEMLEAIGHEQLKTFFATCDRLLEPDGLACVQTIDMPDQRYERYRRQSDCLPRQRRETVAGVEVALATHLLGPWVLTSTLRPLLAAAGSGRVLWMSSGGMYTQRLRR